MSRPTVLPCIGDRFGRWTVTGEPEWAYSERQRRTVLPCRCDCGTERLVLLQSLRRKDRTTPSCGCWRQERAAQQADLLFLKHGRARRNTRDPLYELWLRINRRCHNPASTQYAWYGARGIAVWEPWRRDPGAFIAYIEENLGPRPEGTSLDRIDNDGNYEPGNLRWATAAEQARNRR